MRAFSQIAIILNKTMGFVKKSQAQGRCLGAQYARKENDLCRVKTALAGTVTAKGAQLSDNQRNNSRWAKEVTIGQQIVFFATAVSFAAGAADMSSGAVAAGFGNFGILLILIRTYFSVPLMVAGLRARDVNWAEREERRLISGGDLAWTALVGRAGWVCLFVSVLLQAFLGVA